MIRKLAIFGSAAAMTLGGFAALAPAAHAATNVVTCDPTDGVTSTATAKPPMPTATDAAFGITLTTTLDGCTANASQLASWVPSKLGGTPNGATIAKAALSVKTKGFGTCNFVAPSSASYTAVGTLQAKWLDAAGKTVAKTTPSSAYVRLSGALATASAALDGTVTKGVGIGADVHASIGFDLANPVNGPVIACNAGTPTVPISSIALVTTASSTLSIDFP